MIKQSRAVYNDEVAEALPLDKWFSVHDFSKLTGVKLLTSYSKAADLVKKGLLDRYPRKNNHDPLLFKMTTTQKAKLIESGKASLANRGRKAQQKNLDNGGYSAMAGKNEKQTKEYIEQEKFLRNAGFI